MAKYIDVRSSDGQLVVLGGAFVLPTSNNPTTTNLVGSIRYNIISNTMEVYNGSAWVSPSGSGIVTSFNTRTGAVTLTFADVTTALGFTPVITINGRSGNVTLISSDITGALGYTPVSTAALGAINGVATLDGTGRLTASQIPSSLIGAVVYQGTWNANTNTPTLTSSVGTKGFYYAVSVAGSTNLDGITQWNPGDVAIFNGTAWEKIDGVQSEVISVAGRTGAVVLSISDISGGAPLASPAFTGLPTAPTPGIGDNSTNIATTAFVDTAIGAAATINTTGGTTTLSQTEYGVRVLLVTGALVSPAVLVVPNNGVWIVSNGTTGAQTLTVKTAGGSGVIVTQGYNDQVVADGTNCVFGQTDYPASAILDLLGSTQGDILYRDASSWQVLAPSTAGYVLQTNGASANPSWNSVGSSSLSPQANNTVLGNISGVTTTPSAITLTALIDSAIGNTQGNILYRNNSVWAVLAPGTSGQFLETQGAAANPQWANAVTSVATGTGLTGGPITTTGTISLASVADATILSNISGGSAAPIANTLTNIIDHDIDNTQGDILYRNASGWVALTPSTSGFVLQTKGAAANPVWSSASGVLDTIDTTQGDILYRGASNWAALTPGASGYLLQTLGASSNPQWTSPSSVLDNFGAAQGDVLYRGSSGWVVLTPSTSGFVLQTKGAAANPVWSSASGVLDTIDTTQGDILYRSGAAWVALTPGTSGQFLQTQGASANPQWHTLTYTDLPAEVQNSLAQVSIPGQYSANAKCMIMAITQNTQVPANFSGSSGYCFVNATNSSAFTVGYVHSGVPASIGTFTFSSGGGSTPALSTQAAVNLVSGDVLYITTPSSADPTLADVGITLVLLKQ